MDFPRTNLLTSKALSRGPDVLRPSSKTAKYGNGEVAFIYTRYKDDKGENFFQFPASMGHEKFTTEPNIMQAMFGPDLARVQQEAGYMRPIFNPDGSETGEKVQDYDNWEIRRQAYEKNIFGRYGNIGGHKVVMFWKIPEDGQGWNMVEDVLDLLHAPDDAIITVGSMELGYVRDFRAVHEPSKKNVKFDQKDTEHWDALSRYHTATGEEKVALQKQLGMHNPTIGYPDTTGWTQEQKDKYPWKRSHYRMKIDQSGITPNPFAETPLSFKAWLEGKK